MDPGRLKIPFVPLMASIRIEDPPSVGLDPVRLEREAARRARGPLRAYPSGRRMGGDPVKALGASSGSA